MALERGAHTPELLLDLQHSLVAFLPDASRRHVTTSGQQLDQPDGANMGRTAPKRVGMIAEAEYVPVVERLAHRIDQLGAIGKEHGNDILKKAVVGVQRLQR